MRDYCKLKGMIASLKDVDCRSADAVKSRERGEHESKRNLRTRSYSQRPASIHCTLCLDLIEEAGLASGGRIASDQLYHRFGVKALLGCASATGMLANSDETCQSIPAGRGDTRRKPKNRRWSIEWMIEARGSSVHMGGMRSLRDRSCEDRNFRSMDVMPIGHEISSM